jgi:hypothetical protein
MNIEDERARFEAHMRKAKNYDENLMARDKQYPTYYSNRIMQAAYEGWLARAEAEGRIAAKLEKLLGEWTEDISDGKVSHDKQLGVEHCILDIRAILPAPPKEDGE